MPLYRTKRIKSVEANKEFLKTNVSKHEQKMLGVLLAGKSLGFIRNEMNRGMQYGGFSCLLNLIYFLSKYNFSQCPNENQFKVHWVISLEESAIKKLNATPSMPAAAPTKRTHKFRESWEERYKGLQFDEKENKTFCKFCREFPNGTNTQCSLTIGTNNFQTA